MPIGAEWMTDQCVPPASMRNSIAAPSRPTVAISAGPLFVQGLRESGLALIGGAALVNLVPLLVTLLVGRHLFRIHPGVLLGICAGAATSAPALAAVQDVANSRIPTLGYGVSYAVGNVLLALWGSVIVVLMA